MTTRKCLQFSAACKVIQAVGKFSLFIFNREERKSRYGSKGIVFGTCGSFHSMSFCRSTYIASQILLGSLFLPRSYCQIEPNVVPSSAAARRRLYPRAILQVLPIAASSAVVSESYPAKVLGSRSAMSISLSTLSLGVILCCTFGNAHRNAICRRFAERMSRRICRIIST